MTPTTLVGLSFFLAMVNAVSPSPFYFFNLQPRILPNSNLTFVLTTRNSSPFSSYRLSFDILNTQTNQTIASVDSKDIPPDDHEGKPEKISLAIPRDVSLGPFALRTRSFRLNRTHASHLVTETLHKLQLDLRNSTILIHLNKDARQFRQGDFVEFSVLVLDKQRRPFLETKKVDISIWKTRPEQFLIRRFPEVSIHPDKPFLTGHFQISKTFYKKPNTKETFQILVTLDERSPDDPSILQGLTVPQSPPEMLLTAPLQDSVFYSHGLIDISTLTKNHSPPKRLGVSVTFKNPFVTLNDPQVDMDVKVTNPLDLPSTSGHCTFKDFHLYCFYGLKHMEKLTQGVLSTRLNLSGTFQPDCLLQNVFSTQQSVEVPLGVKCTDNQFHESASLITNKVFISVGSFLVSHVAVNYPEEPSLLFRITGKDYLPPGSEVTTGSSLQVTYVFHNGSQVSVNESVIEGGFAEHVLRELVTHRDLSHLTAAFKDSGPLRIDKCDGCPEKVETQRSPAMWLTHSNSKRIVAGKSAEVTVVSTSPVAHFHLRLTNRLGVEWETLEPVTPSKVISPSPFVTFVNLTFPPDITKVEFIDGDFQLNVDVEVEAPVEINDTGNPLLLLTPPKTAGSLKVFGIFAQTHWAAGLPHFSKDSTAFGLCAIISPGAERSTNKPSCDISGPVGITARRRETFGPISYMEITGKGAEDIPARLHFQDTPGEFQNGWLWTSASTHSDSLSIRTSLPSNVTHPQDFYGVLIDDLHGYRVTQPTTFDPKSPFDLFIRPPDNTNKKILGFTLFNNSNKTLSNVTLFQTDQNKRIVFQGTQGDYSFSSNTSLPFGIPPFTHKQFNTSFRSHRPGVVNFRAVASVNNVHSAVETGFLINPKRNDFIASFDVLIDNVNQTESSLSLSIPTDIVQQLKPNTSYHVDASVSFNFLPEPFIRYFMTAIRRPNFAVVAVLLPLYASLGMLTPTSQRLLEDFVTSKLSSLNVSDLNPLSNHPPTILQSLLNLNDFQPGIVDLTTLSDLTQFVLHNYFPIQNTQSQAKVCPDFFGQLGFFSNTQTILALHAALNHSDLIFPHNSSLKEQISSAIAEGTKVILDDASNSSASHLAILATTRLLQLIGHPRAPEFINRAAPIISQITEGSKTRRNGNCREPYLLQQSEESLALLIHSTRGNLKQAYILAKGFKALTESTLDETYIIPNALTAFAKLARSAQFSTNRISVHPQPNYWQVGDELHLNIRGTGIGLAKIYFSQVNEIPT